MKLRFSGLLLRVVDYQRDITISAGTLGEALDIAENRYPQLRPVLRDGDGQLRRAHRVFINGEQAGDVDLATELSDADEVEFLTAIAGG